MNVCEIDERLKWIDKEINTKIDKIDDSYRYFIKSIHSA